MTSPLKKAFARSAAKSSATAATVARVEPANFMIKKGIYEHFKGKRYEVVDVARHSETLEEMVIYKALYKGDFPEGTLWVRPLTMFQENVTVNGKSVPRFRYLCS